MLEEQRELRPKIESQPEAWRKVPQQSTLPAVAVARDSWEEKFQEVAEGSLQKKADQTNDRCRPDETPDEEREVMSSWTKIGSQDGETYLHACRVTTSVWKKCVIRTVQSVVESSARTGFPTRHSRTVGRIWNWMMSQRAPVAWLPLRQGQLWCSDFQVIAEVATFKLLKPRTLGHATGGDHGARWTRIHRYRTFVGSDYDQDVTQVGWFVSVKLDSHSAVKNRRTTVLRLGDGSSDSSAGATSS